MKPKDLLKLENCNKAKCKTCIFHEDEQSLPLVPGRLDGIKKLLATGKSSHICHTTQKTCYGALEFQSKVFYAIKIIPEPTVKSLLETAANYI